MRLVSCHIENFGRLRDFSLEFQEGCNVICCENGWGKSTLASFIKVMLYGFEEEKSRDELKNERKRYRPWQGGIYGGRLEFETGGEHYVISRTFGIKEKEDRFSLRKKSTNLECQDYSTAVGEDLFSLDCNSFLRTVFVSQNDCATASTDMINAKLGNLAEDTDDINNYESVNQRFLDLINQMSPTRKTGSLYKLKEEINRLEENVRVGRDVDQAIEEICARLHDKLEEQQTLKEEQTQLLEKQREINVYKDIQRKREKYKDLCQEYEERKQRAQEEKSYFPGRVPGRQELEDIIAKSSGLSAALETVRIYSLTEEEIQRGKQLELFFAGGCPDQETLKDLEEQAGELQKLRVSLAENQLSGEEKQRLRDYERRFVNGVPQVQDVDNVIANWNSCVEKKNLLGQKKLTYEALRGISQTGRNNGGSERENIKPSFAGMIIASVGAVLILAGILLGTVGAQAVIGILTSLLGLSALVAGIVWCLPRNRKGFGKSRENQDTKVSETNDSLERMGEEIRKDETFIEMAFCETTHFLENYEIGYERESEILDRLYGFKAEIREYITLSRRGNDLQMDDLQEKCQIMTENLQKFLINYYADDCPEEGDFVARLSEIKEFAVEYKTLKKKGENLLRSQKSYKELQVLLRDFVESLSITAEEDISSQLLGLRSRLQSLENSMQELKVCEQKKEIFESEENVEEILKAGSMEAMEDMEALEGVGERLKEIGARLEQVYQYISDYNHQLDSLREEGDSVAEDAESLVRLREEYSRGLEKFELLKKTRELMEQAKVSFTSKYTEPLRKGLGKYYGLLTGEDPSRVYVDANLDVTIDEQGMQREPRFFSAGYRDLIGICMRMALVDAMYEEEKPFILFDDPFANLDNTKLEEGLKLLGKIAGQYQVLYFTCHESRTIVQ